MASSILPDSVARILDLARRLSAEDRRLLLDNLLAERFDAVLADADRQRGVAAELSDSEIQSEIDEVRRR